MALVSTLSAPAPQMAAPLAKQMAQAKSRDRVSEFLAQNAHASPDQLAGQYGEHFDAGGGFGFGDASALGGDQLAAGAINARMRDLLSKNVGFQRANLLRGATGDYMDRQSRAQSVHEGVIRQRHLEEQIRAQIKAQKKAKQQGMKTALLGLAGAGAGAMIGSPHGGAQVGAIIGSGAGQSAANF